MKVLRLKIKQTKAAYAREETVGNRMSYPLPPFSTIIGALHSACGYESYNEMDISIQGRYSSMQREIYVNHGLLNNQHDDRGNLIWLKNSNALSTGYIRVAEALNGTGNSFENRITIRVDDEEKLNEYSSLKKLSRVLKEEQSKILKPMELEWKEREKILKEELKKLDKNSKEAKKLKEEIAEGKGKIKTLKEEYKADFERRVSEPLSHFRTLTKGPQYQEVLYDVELVIHIRAHENTLLDIVTNELNLTNIGRSEDFIELEEMKFVEVTDEIEDEYKLPKGYKMYVNIDKVGEDYYDVAKDNRTGAEGTVYYLSKNYVIENKKRVFNRIPCIYSSSVVVDEDSDALIDEDGYIVNFN